VAIATTECILARGQSSSGRNFVADFRPVAAVSTFQRQLVDHEPYHHGLRRFGCCIDCIGDPSGSGGEILLEASTIRANLNTMPHSLTHSLTHSRYNNAAIHSKGFTFPLPRNIQHFLEAFHQKALLPFFPFFDVFVPPHLHHHGLRQSQPHGHCRKRRPATSWRIVIAQLIAGSMECIHSVDEQCRKCNTAIGIVQ
jgi:hypothetical protein